MFPTIRVNTDSSAELEPLGTKRKFWFMDSAQRRMLFKAEERGTGDDWAEKIACELAALLGLPHVHYDLASTEDLPGVICESCAPPPWSLLLGNQLMLARDPAYPAEEAKKYKVRAHTIRGVAAVLEPLQLPPEPWCSGLPDGIQTAADVFAGYLMLDAWVANQDRHHENWGALRGPGGLYLAPSFDHGACLARNLADPERLQRLRTKDVGHQIETFASRARSAFYGDSSAERPLGTFDAFRACSLVSPQATRIWLMRLAAVAEPQVMNLLAEVPPDRLSAIGQEFTHALLASNRRRLLEGIKP